MKKQIFLAVLVVGMIAGALGLVKFLQIRSAMAQAASRQAPPESVTTFVVRLEQWPETISVVGTVAPVQGATLGAEDIGKVMRIHFESGTSVKAGDVLVELDTSIEEAQLKGALAQLDLSKVTLARAESLREKSVNSQSELDTAQAQFRAANAQVETFRAQIARKRIAAPFAGVAGIRQVNVGQVVIPGSPIVSLEAFDPVYLNFSVPQENLSRLEIGQAVSAQVDAYPDLTFSGKLTAINSKVSESTRNIDLQATFPNPDAKLRPGMFADITVVFPKVNSFLTIPASSVDFAPYGNTVFILDTPSDPAKPAPISVHQQFVQLGRRRGDQIAVLGGLESGQEVVSSGTFKLRPGAKVIVNNSIAPGSEAAPRPADT